MSNRTMKDAATNILFVPLDKLKKSPKNVRKVPHTKTEIKAFAASIAAIGMLHYPVVEPEIGPKGKPTGHYLVNAGEGRRLAQLLRAKRKEIRPDEPIRCLLDTEHSATEISLGPRTRSALPASAPTTRRPMLPFLSAKLASTWRPTGSPPPPATSGESARSGSFTPCARAFPGERLRTSPA
jgi:hypothetical protein